MIRLYDDALSGNCYKVRLLLSALGLAYERYPIELYPAREHKSEAFLRINPLGELPVLDDDGLILSESQAILVYLAEKYDASAQWWLAGDPAQRARILQWLSFAERLNSSVGQARLHEAMFYPGDIDALRREAHRLFRVLDEHIWFAEAAGDQFLASRTLPTLADLACFPFVMLSEEGGISRLAYPAIRRWADRVKRMPNFVAMPGIFDAGAALV
jgi:glutathione S-transferase